MHNNPDRLTHMEYIKARKSKLSKQHLVDCEAEITGLTESLISKTNTHSKKDVLHSPAAFIPMVLDCLSHHLSRSVLVELTKEFYQAEKN